MYSLMLTLMCIAALGNEIPKTEEPVAISIRDDFLTTIESEILLKSYGPLLQDSMHQGKEGVTRGGKYRTSHSVRLPPLGDDLLLDLEVRAASLVGMDHKHCEDFQLACYGEDELFGLHRDDTDSRQTLYRGATVLVYLSSPELGGETLFTNSALEDELDLDTGKRLTTQDGALKLFRHYCKSPPKDFTVVKPVVGRAVSWRTWNTNNDAVFATNSTHGACPVKAGKKCVIQQWLYRSKKVHPLRDPRVSAIFPAGADSRYKTKLYYESLSAVARNCMFDVSAKKRTIIPHLCIIKSSERSAYDNNKGAALFQLNDYDYGPHTGVSSLRIKSPLVTSLPIDLIQSGFTISFHAANLSPNYNVLSIGVYASVTYLGRTDEGLTFELSSSHSSSKISFFHWGLDTDWFWYSFTYHPMTNLSSFSIFSDRKKLGYGTVSLGSTKIADTKDEISLEFFGYPRHSCMNDSSVKVAFVSQACDNKTDAPDSFVDVSFVVFHSSVIENEKELLSLSRQAMRYDINT